MEFIRPIELKIQIYFIFNNCLMDTKCPNKISGTMNVGNQLKGKCSIAMFGWSKANFWMGEGAENKAFKTMLIKRPRQIKFHNEYGFF